MAVGRLALISVVLAARSAAAEVGECHVVDVKFTPALPASTAGERHEPSQMVVWLESTAGEYLQTIFITQQTGRYGMGNRPGRFDFNSGPMWPYGRRETTFPVWAHRRNHHYPRVVMGGACGNSPQARCSSGQLCGGDCEDSTNRTSPAANTRRRT